MSAAPSRPSPKLTARFIEGVCQRLAESKRVRRTLPEKGRFNVDRQVPFLCVYRRPPRRPDEGTDRLAVGEAAYLVAPGDSRRHTGVRRLVEGIVGTLSPVFGGFLVVEVWSADGEDTARDELSSAAEAPAPRPRRPRFRVVTRRTATPEATVETLRRHLARVHVQKLAAEVEVVPSTRLAPPGLPVLLPQKTASALNCHVIGLEVRPIYRHPGTGEEFPQVRRSVRRQVKRALRWAFYRHARTQTTHRPRHYQALGPRSVVRAVWDVDRQLWETGRAYDFLLQVTPVNADAAWSAFKRNRFERAPLFRYRPQAADPDVLRRKLWSVPVERIEDPTLAELFDQKREELSAELSMLAHLERPQFLAGSHALFGRPDAELLASAEELLRALPARSRRDSRQGMLNATQFAELADEELAHYREQYPSLRAKVRVRPDISGLLVSRGRLLVGKRVRVPVARAEAALQHEIGTHVLTFANGRAQPFRLLRSGLAGYEELQEGLAVLSEHLVGGLTPARLRLLAGRVVAVEALADGADFVETFRLLERTYRFTQRTSYTTAMRVYRGGGLTKDAVYLRGLVRLLSYLGDAGDLEPLLLGKIAFEHVAFVQELRWRDVLVAPLLRPRYLAEPGAQSRLERLREGATVVALIEKE